MANSVTKSVTECTECALNGANTKQHHIWICSYPVAHWSSSLWTYWVSCWRQQAASNSWLSWMIDIQSYHEQCQCWKQGQCISRPCSQPLDCTIRNTRQCIRQTIGQNTREKFSKTICSILGLERLTTTTNYPGRAGRQNNAIER